jgi:hypothetical protein
MSTVRINLWSGPRNISTALMYSFAQREDTRVFDEPLYAHYLTRTDARDYHPGAEDIIASQENDGAKVVRETLFGEHGKPVLFFKQMTHHLVELDWGFMGEMVNVILTRDPRDMLPSYAQQIAAPSLRDVGYAQHLELLVHLRSLGQEPPVLDSRQTLLDPRGVLKKLCAQIAIPFDEAMLHWEAGPRPEDGVWAPHWYHNVHCSTQFQAYKPKTEFFPKHLQSLLAESQPYYDQLAALAIG